MKGEEHGLESLRQTFCGLYMEGKDIRKRKGFADLYCLHWQSA